MKRLSSPATLVSAFLFVVLGAGSAGALSTCCIERSSGGCDTPTCQACVCAVDPYCCSNSWDTLCVQEATNDCAGSCPVCVGCGNGSLGAGEQCEAPFGACCDSATCQFLPAATPCRAGSGDMCDPAEACTGSAATCPTDVIVSPGTTCRAGSGDFCDPTEVCSGTPGVPCPSDTVQSAGTTCRAGSGDACDPSETCTGTPGAECPDDIVAAPETVCRAGSGDSCDPDEMCTGEAAAPCPEDVIEAPGSTCRPGSSDMCDPDESCTGEPGAACPSDVVTEAGTVCRVAVADCDAAEACSGDAGLPCPADQSQPAGASCTDGNACTDDQCDGAGQCASTDNDAACDDGDACTVGDACQSGACAAGDPLDCDDGSPCTTDSCARADGCHNDAAPRTGSCFLGGVGRLLVHDEGGSDDDTLKWAWKRGEEVAADELGDPTATTVYGLCVFDRVAAVPSLVAELIVPAGARWTATGSSVSYSDSAQTSAGVRTVKVKAGRSGKSKVQWKASGLALDLPGPIDGSAYFAADPEVIVELRNSEGACWSTGFGAEDVRVNDPITFKASVP